MESKDKLYTVLLVDDEEDVIRIIMDRTDWASMGFRVTGYAHNGIEALELAEEQQPDVVMTDIKMPYMDGLALSRRLKEIYPDCRIVIFSGFDEFEYAKEAIELEVEQYLLKPIDPSELREVFTKVRGNLDRERAERGDIDRLRENYMKSLPLLQEVFFTSLIEGRIPENRIEEYLEGYQIHLSGPIYVVAVIHISGRGGNMDAVLKTVSVRDMLDKWLENRYTGKSLNYLEDIVLIAQIADRSALPDFTDEMDAFCRMVKRGADCTVTAGIGQPCGRLADIRLSYQGARSAVSYRALYGNNRAINISEIEPQTGGDLSWERDLLSGIMKHLRLGNRQALDEEIDRCVPHFREAGFTLQRYQLFILTLCTEILEFCASNNLDMDFVTGNRQKLYEKVFQSDSPEEMSGWMKELCHRGQEMYLKQREDSTLSFVSRSIEYVGSHYADTDISIETVCRELGVSAAYFSTVFKKETGKTFISYLTDYRMEKAVELLMTTQDRTYMIADKVGYADSNYFSYVFKKQFGTSPSRYRAERLKEREA